jgi:hypothetical protein
MAAPFSNGMSVVRLANEGARRQMSIAATSPRSVHKVSVRAVVDPSHRPADDGVVAEHAS